VCEETAAQNALRIFRNGRLIRVCVEFLTPLDPLALGDRKAISAHARSAIVEALEARIGKKLNPHRRFLPPYGPPESDAIEQPV
jgi:hypothetical protein